MSTIFWLTNEKSDVQGYLRLKREARSDCPSMVRKVVPTVAGPTTGLVVGSWLTDPLDGKDLTAGNWRFDVWASQNNLSANAGIRFQMHRFTASVGEDGLVVDDTTAVALATQPRSSGRSSAATATPMENGDRLALLVLVDDAATMATGYQVTVSYNGLRSRSEGDSYIVCPDSVGHTAGYPEATRTAIRQMIQDVSQTNPVLKDQSVDESLHQALRDYSRDKPCVESEYLSGDGATRSFGMPRRWVYGLSSITEIEYPVEADATTRILLADDEWEILEGVLGMQPTRSLRFISVPQTGTDNILVRYTTRHIHTDEEDTVGAQDWDAVVCQAAAYCCLQLASNAAAHTLPTITADAVSGRDAAAQWQSLAKDLRARYVDQILGGGGDTPIGAASVTKDWDIEPSTWHGDFLFHPKGAR